MPSLGADMAAGRLVQWLKAPGDRVARGDLIAEVDTDKGAIEIEVFIDGVLAKTLVEPGQKVPVGTPLALIERAEPPATAAAPAAPAAPAAASADNAQAQYAKFCTICHGADGRGDTKLGKANKARDYTDPKVKASLKDDAMFKAIKEGLTVGDKKPMPAYADKLSDDEIKALMAYMKTFK